MINPGILNSKIFLVLGTESFFKDIPIQDVMAAKGLNKPFRVVIIGNPKIPKWFSEGVKDYKEMRFRNKDDVFKGDSLVKFVRS